jgi:hypothetical protein
MTSVTTYTIQDEGVSIGMVLQINYSRATDNSKLSILVKAIQSIFRYHCHRMSLEITDHLITITGKYKPSLTGRITRPEREAIRSKVKRAAHLFLK